MITKVFPDEYHLNTLDQLLSAISRLNPHVDMKKIVIGLMDRLSTFAQRESEQKTPEDKQKAEEAAMTQLLAITSLNETTAAQPVTDGSSTPPAESDGTKTDNSPAHTPASTKPEATTNSVNGQKTPTGNKTDVREVLLFEIFYDQVVNLVKTRALPIQDTMALLTSLVNLASNIYPDRLEYVDKVLGYAAEKANEHADSADLHAAGTQSNMLNLLLAPVRTYVSLFTALALPHYLPLYLSQTYATRKSVAAEVSKMMLRNRIKITSTEQLGNVLTILSVIINASLQQASSYAGLGTRQRNGETDEIVEEQGSIARIVHLVQGPDNDIQLKLLQQIRRVLEAGNERIRYTCPALVTASLKLARRYKSREHLDDNWQSQSSTLYRFMHQTISQMYTRVSPSAAELCLRLFVSCGQTADQCGFEEFAYEFFAQAFTVYEDSISDSRAQFQAVCILAGALQITRGFGKENYDTLVTKAALHGSKLLKKPDQCRAVYLASHLWWSIEIPGAGEDDTNDVSCALGFRRQEAILTVNQLYRDGKRVLECLQRALRVADACMDTAVSVELFVEILNRYVYYFDQQNETVSHHGFMYTFKLKVILPGNHQIS